MRKLIQSAVVRSALRDAFTAEDCGGKKKEKEGKKLKVRRRGKKGKKELGIQGVVS